MEIWARNMEALGRRDPSLAARLEDVAAPAGVAVERARNGEPIARRDGICLHSPYDPSRDAGAWLKQIDRDAATPLTVLGLGLGYHLRALAEAGFHGAFVEPDLGLFRLALEQLDLSRALERFRPVVGLSPEEMRRVHRDLLAGEVVTHPASLRTNPAYFGQLADYGRALALVRQRGLKILLVNPIYGGSLPAARHCAGALEEMGHEVEIFSAEAFAAGMAFGDRFSFPEHRKNFLAGMVSFLSEGVELMAREFEPDLVLALAQAPLHHPTLGRLEQMGIPTAFWFVEDYRVLPYWRDVAAGYGYFFAIQKGELDSELERCGVRRHAYLPTAAAPHVHAPRELTDAEREEFGSPLSFVGAGYYNRQRFFRGLADYPFKIWGSDWPLALPLAPLIQRGAARVDTDTCVKIFNASAINLNLHSSTRHEGVDPAGDFVNPRTFEIASCSAFQLVDRRALMGELFASDEVATFTGMAELRDKIDHYRADPEARRTIAEKGRQRVLAEHSYRARMEELLALMVLAFPVIAEKQRHRSAARESLVAKLGEQEGLNELLAKLPRGRTVKMKDIYRTIIEGEGKLSRAEKIFLMLKNIDVVREVKR